MRHTYIYTASLLYESFESTREEVGEQNLLANLSAVGFYVTRHGGDARF